jgi:hypothetical protein
MAAEDRSAEDSETAAQITPLACTAPRYLAAC